MYVLLLGAPGAGKGTQAAMLQERLALPHVASGDLFRDNLKRETELGLKAKGYMERGELVPDDVTIAMVLERLSRADTAKGALLDGFPRTIQQAEALDAALITQGRKIEKVINFNVSEDALIARLSGRWICRNCQAAYHTLYNPPQHPGRCDVCGGELYQRADDTPETVANRLKVYFNQTRPLIDYYQQRGLLVNINGEQEIEQVKQDILNALK
ncbi:MAG: adenylate kinase [Chloroflexi bacterium RBG_16_57_9]|nr:MAG: adenylate kinase [Chloroflexi bacterium RBG_16_57_9]